MQGVANASRVRRAAWLAALALTASCSTCDDGGHATNTPDAAPVVEPPAPAPPDLLAEGVIATPDTTWARVQRGIGGITALMAPTAGGLVASLAGADPSLGVEVDGAAAAYVVVAEVGKAPAFALALRLKSAPRANAALSADAGRHRPGADEGNLTIYEPLDPSRLAVGVSRGGWLVLARTRQDLVALGPYAYRTLPTRPLPTANAHLDVLPGALSRTGARALSDRWAETRAFLLSKDAESRKTHGREADFGDASAIVALLDGWVKGKLDTLADVARGAVDVDIATDDLQIKATLEPGGGASKAALDAMKPGDLGVIGGVPWDTIAFVVTREDAAGREKNAHDAAEGIASVLGKRLPAPEAKQLDGALADFAKARGDWILFGATKRGIMLRTPAPDASTATRAFRGVLGLTDRPALRAPLTAAIGFKSLSFADADYGPAGKGFLAPIARDATVGPSYVDPKVEVGWVGHDGRLEVGAGADADDIIAEHQLDDRPARQLSTLGPDVAFAAIGRWTVGEMPSVLSVLRRDGKLVVLFDATFNFVKSTLTIVERGL